MDMQESRACVFAGRKSDASSFRRGPTRAADKYLRMCPLLGVRNPAAIVLCDIRGKGKNHGGEGAVRVHRRCNFHRYIFITPAFLSLSRPATRTNRDDNGITRALSCKSSQNNVYDKRSPSFFLAFLFLSLPPYRLHDIYRDFHCARVCVYQ